MCGGFGSWAGCRRLGGWEGGAVVEERQRTPDHRGAHQKRTNRRWPPHLQELGPIKYLVPLRRILGRRWICSEVHSTHTPLAKCCVCSRCTVVIHAACEGRGALLLSVGRTSTSTAAAASRAHLSAAALCPAESGTRTHSLPQMLGCRTEKQRRLR